MDTAFGIPGTKFKVGLDPIIGLIPGAGDAIATAVSAYILILATRFRLPGNVLRQMIFNVLLETAVGTIPVLGDIFDAAYKSNIRNLALLETHLQAEALNENGMDSPRLENEPLHPMDAGLHQP